MHDEEFTSAFWERLHLRARESGPPAEHATLTLSRGELAGDGAKKLRRALEDPGRGLRSLDLSEAGVCAYVIRELAPALAGNRSLTCLDISKNDLSDSGAAILFQALSRPRGQLQKLWLYSNRLTYRCCPDLAHCLRANPALTHINLSGNNLRDPGVTTLSEGLRDRACQIQELRLWNNGISDIGCIALTSALCYKDTLTDLDLADNLLTNRCLANLSHLKQTCISLRSFRLSGNRFSPAQT